MAFHFEPGEHVPEAVRRIFCEELEHAAGQLSRGRGAPLDEAIHEARKSLKKARAVLRLLRPELESTYRAENGKLRGIARRLSNFRDAGVMVETLDSLVEDCRQELGANIFAAVRRALARRKRETERQAGLAALLTKLGASLRAAARRAQAWPVQADGFAALAPGFEKTFRQGRKALAETRRRPRPENYHAWRKRVKDHWYHVRLLGSDAGAWMESYEQDLKKLETSLGEGQNLTLLRGLILAEPGSYGTPANVALLAALIARRRKTLRDKALALGGRIYGRNTRVLLRRASRGWNAMQAAAAHTHAA
ncbi:MAG TPA: CHAD domain-containing protein [Bryobacteraceae bacterium]